MARHGGRHLPDSEDGSEQLRWQHDYLGALDPYSTEAVYVNYIRQNHNIPPAE